MKIKNYFLIAFISMFVCLTGCGAGDSNADVVAEENSVTISEGKITEDDDKMLAESSADITVADKLGDEMEKDSEEVPISEGVDMEQAEEAEGDEPKESIDYGEYENYKDWIYTRIEDGNSDDLKSISEERFKEIILADMESITETRFSEVSMKRITEDGWYVITAHSNKSFSFNGEFTNEVTYVSNIVLGETVDNSGYAFYLDLK